jgi:hypothetical protein
MVVVAVTMVWISGLSLTSPYWQLGLAFALEGVGVGLSVSPLTSTAMNAASPQQRGAASGFFNTVRFVGAVLGTTILGVVLSDRTQTALSRVHAASFSQRHALAMLQGFHDVYLVAGAIGLLSALTALWLRPGFASAQPVVRPGRRQPTGDPSSYM